PPHVAGVIVAQIRFFSSAHVIKANPPDVRVARTICGCARDPALKRPAQAETRQDREARKLPVKKIRCFLQKICINIYYYADLTKQNTQHIIFTSKGSERFGV
ncbi:MAG: hypothetical protein VB039_07160, partial [Oscillospiraceae bacterium]|nr:hypothetical protein [Oscillospiraceae bacterium]